jgi:hypothetical protein
MPHVPMLFFAARNPLGAVREALPSGAPLCFSVARFPHHCLLKSTSATFRRNVDGARRLHTTRCGLGSLRPDAFLRTSVSPANSHSTSPSTLIQGCYSVWMFSESRVRLDPGYRTSGDGMVRRAVWHKFTDVSEVLTASIFMLLELRQPFWSLAHFCPQH